MNPIVVETAEYVEVKVAVAVSKNVSKIDQENGYFVMACEVDRYYSEDEALLEVSGDVDGTVIAKGVLTVQVPKV
jgi:phosphatidate phosphatase APP1